MGKRGVLWCGPSLNIPSEEKPRLARANQLIIGGNDSFMTCYLPANNIDPSLLRDTNGAGDNFCAGVIRAIIDESNKNATKTTLNSQSILPNLKSIEAGLESSRSWLLRFSESPKPIA